jgi:WD40 repeat protein
MLFLEGRRASARRLAFSPDGGLLASAAEDGREVSVWDAVCGRHRADLTGHTDAITSLAFDPAGGTLASGDRRGNVRLWDAAAGRPLPDTPFAPTGLLTCLAFSPDGAFGLTCGANEAEARLWDLNTGKELGRIGGGVTPRSGRRSSATAAAP